MPGHRSRALIVVAAALVAAALLVPDRDPGGPAASGVAVVPSREVSTFELTGQTTRFALEASASGAALRATSGRTSHGLDLSIVVDGVERALVPSKVDPSRKGALTAAFPVEIGEDRATGSLSLSVDPVTDAMIVSVTVTTKGGVDHPIALRATTSPGEAAVFVPERGELADVGELETRSLVVDDDVHPLGLVSKRGAFTVGESGPEVDTQPVTKPRLTSTFNLSGGPSARAEVALLLGASTEAFWGSLYALLGTAAVRVSGVVSGTNEHAEVFGLDDGGHPLVRVPTDAQGRFVVDVPRDTRRWYASLEAGRNSSAVVHHDPTDAREVRLEVVPSAQVHVRVIDPDTGVPLLARVVVRGLDGAVDPTFGHDFRTSGAGPLVDVGTGEVTKTLAPGRYRISAMKGLEWSIDAEVVVLASGHTRTVELRPRHVVVTPGLVGCDLHVHARPSFDTSVTPEDRVLSLVSAGIDFAVPTEHNVVGDYTLAAEHMDLRGSLAHVSGIEVTTANPRIGHFGVFPYPKTAAPLPHKHTTANALFSAVRRGDPSRVLVVHHPRLPGGIGYFQVANFDPRSGKVPSAMRTDFDVLEVYNGYELATRAKTDAILVDWYALLNLGMRHVASGSSDSHKIQFQWAGYPRTYVRVDPAKAGDTGPIDPAAVVDAVRAGRGFVTSGPLVDLEVSGVQPGGELDPRDGHVTAHLRVRAAPWIDVTSVELVAGGTSLRRIDVASRPAVTGREAGSIDEAAARTLRYEADVELSLPPGAKWLIALVRGDRAYDDLLPFMPVQPLAFTNPIWLR